MYLTKNDAIEIIRQIQSFESDLNNIFKSRGYSFRGNLGRRNALISIAQEKETAKVLRKNFKEVIEDGRPGKPDIYIADIDRELECKITSGSKTKGTSRSFSFQTDWETICNKGKLDYVYIMCDENFQKFCFLYFDSLTSDDFFPPASGSRGKSRMNKAKAMKKVSCLIGNYIVRNDMHISSIKNTLAKESNDHLFKIRELHKKYNSILECDIEKKNIIVTARDNETIRHQNKIKKLSDRLSYWKNAGNSYTFTFEEIE